MRAEVGAKRREDEKYTIDFRDLDPELVRALLKDGGRIWATCPSGKCGKGLLFLSPKRNRHTSSNLKINGYKAAIEGIKTGQMGPVFISVLLITLDIRLLARI